MCVVSGSTGQMVKNKLQRVIHRLDTHKSVAYICRVSVEIWFASQLSGYSTQATKENRQAFA